ncbi:transcription factor Ouib-like isoform X2 [Drosophila innubila]|uniref:transcription factor Ouib-like isoform X2 n=1 Tax=Drosophila innubila TaxID=198719 RepID=UPI00148D64E3|nr:transcription factor Ouib-like isoform X2 [Drosophila innubila]
MTLQCRTCGNVIYNKNATNLFQFENMEILKNIQMVVGTALECDSELPSHICGCCLLDLKQAVFHIKVFRERCIKTQEKLQSTLGILKTSLHIDSQHKDSINNITKEDIYFESDEEIHEIDELEADEDVGDLEDLVGFQEDDSSISSGKTEMNGNDSQKSVEDVEEISVNDLGPNDNQGYFLSSSDVASESAETDHIETEKKKIFKESSPDHSGKNDQNKSRKAKVKKKRYTNWKNLTEEQVIERKRQQRLRNFICDQCGRHFTDQSNFKLHMLRHTGIKNFQCKECSKRFYTEHLLQWHERIVHQDEHPYSCRYCDKTFKNSTGRLVHERCHTNERPYPCEFCGKAFSAVSGLKRHLLIHNGVRAYFCAICDRNFQRNTHLKAHLRSKQHAFKQANEDLLRETK